MSNFIGREAIAKAEAEAAAKERERIRAAIARVAEMQGDYVITAMSGATRHPHTPADWVEAYRAAVLAAIEETDRG